MVTANITRNRTPFFLTIPILAGVTPAAVAQIGTMAYGPAAVTAVPIGGGLFLVALGAILGTMACLRIYKGKSLGTTSLSVFLLLGAVMFSSSGGKLLYEAYAAGATPLSNPQGEIIQIFPGYQEYENTSGTPLRIGAINIDECPQAPEAQAQAALAYPLCESGSTVLENGDICTTDYPPCVVEGERITFQAGYYWVRADYAAPRADHAAVCAEFGLSATAYDVPLTWDATLLESLSTAFGYQSAGDYNNAATSMWCWDGDGGPGISAGFCGTHNFGASYVNYGLYSSDPDIRPVFTCTDAP